MLKYALTSLLISTYSLEVVAHLKLILLVCHVTLHLRVGVIDDGQEHVDQDKEDEEHKQHEEDWTKDTVCSLQLVKVEVSENDTEQGEAEIVTRNGLKVFHQHKT